MSVIDDLYKKLGLRAGSWGTPELGLTELAANKISGGKTSDLSNAVSNAVTGNAAGSSSSGNGISADWINKQSKPAYASSSPSAGGGGSNPNPDTTYVNVDGNNMKLRDAIGEGKANPDGSLKQSADNSYQSRLNSIKAQLGMMKEVAQRSIDRAKGVRDEVVNNIGTTYQGLLDTAGVKRDSSLSNLDTEAVNTENTYGRAAGTTRRAMDSAIAKNRMAARATNRLNSSFYDDRQASTTEAGARGVADIATEQAGKLTGIGTRKTETKNWFDQESTRIAGERDSLKSQADREYQDAVSAANDTEQKFGLDSADALTQAADEYQSRIAAIDNYAMNRALQIAQIAATNVGTGKSSIDSFSAVTPELATKLADTTAVDKAKTLAAGGFSDTSFTPSTSSNNNQDLTAFYKQDEKTNAYQAMLKRLGLLA